MTESWGYYCLNHNVRFRISSFKSCWEKGLLPCGDPLWGCGFYVYTQRFGGVEQYYRIEIKRILTTGQHIPFFDGSLTREEIWARIELTRQLGNGANENSVFQEHNYELAKTLENVFDPSLTGWRGQ